MSFLSTAVQDVLDRGQFCAVATMTPRGPHCTPLVYVGSGARVWLTTSRRSVKASAWRRDPAMAGLVRDGELAVTFTGTVRTYDALDRRTWGAAVARATSIARATAASAPRTHGSSPGTRSTRIRCPRMDALVRVRRCRSRATALLDAHGAGGPGPLGGSAGSADVPSPKGSDPFAP
jgi:hypothetical protein